MTPTNDLPLVNFDRVCGVVTEAAKPDDHAGLPRVCMRSLHCKTHTLKEKRLIRWRSRDFDKLAADYRQRTVRIPRGFVGGCRLSLSLAIVITNDILSCVRAVTDILLSRSLHPSGFFYPSRQTFSPSPSPPPLPLHSASQGMSRSAAIAAGVPLSERDPTSLTAVEKAELERQLDVLQAGFHRMRAGGALVPLGVGRSSRGLPAMRPPHLSGVSAELATRIATAGPYKPHPLAIRSWTVGWRRVYRRKFATNYLREPLLHPHPLLLRR